MALQLDAATQLCREITRQVRENYKTLTVHFIIHHDGQRNEALGVTAQEIIHHPAADTAMRIMQQPRLNEESSLLGTAVARSNLFMGLAWRDHLLALCTINIDHADNLKDIRRQAWHLTWHAIDSYQYHSNPDSHRSGPYGNVVVRRRGAVEMARANMQADSFSAIICALQSDRDAIHDIGRLRALNTLGTRSAHMPEFYPYAIAMEAAEFAFSEIGKKQPSKRMVIPAALKLAHEIDRSIDPESLMNWFSFCEPAQDMAWRGFSKEDILSAAINTSPDTFVRSTGHLIKEITALAPTPFLNISAIYSPFADDAINEKLHDKLIEQIFEDVIAKGISLHSPDPFIKLANKQNEELSEGRMMGWCAGALQAAARALERSTEGDRQTEQLIRKEFKESRNNTDWDTLNNLGTRIVKHQRDGEIITLSRLSEIAGEDKSSRAIQAAVQTTINDPEYQNKLEYLNVPTPHSLAPRGPAPSAAPRISAPGPRIPGPFIPGMGGSGHVQVARQIGAKADDKGDKDRPSK